MKLSLFDKKHRTFLLNFHLRETVHLVQPMVALKLADNPAQELQTTKTERNVPSSFNVISFVVGNETVNDNDVRFG